MQSSCQKLATVVALVALAGCASVPMGDETRDAELKKFAARPGVASIYVYRSEPLGVTHLLEVELDGKTLGRTATKTYLYAEVAPGKHTITSKAENTDTIEIDTVAGRLYFVWQEVKLGLLKARTKLHLVDENRGRADVWGTKLAATNLVQPGAAAGSVQQAGAGNKKLNAADYQSARQAYQQERYQEAHGLWQAAARRGDVASMYELGKLYGEGLGVLRDTVRAHAYFNVAASKGHKQALAARQIVEQRLTPEELAKAEKLARDLNSELAGTQQ